MGVFTTTELQRRLVASPLFAQRVDDVNGTGSRTIRYGTAGFRFKGTQLAPIAARMGPLLAARAQEYSHAHHQSHHTGARANNHHNPAQDAPPMLVFGAMITASHNAAIDNGLKLVEPNGSMLNIRWEARATELARTHLPDGSDFLRIAAETLQEVAARLDPAVPPTQQQQAAAKFRPFTVLIGQDTRPSGPEIADALAQSVRAFGGLPILCGMMTTPMLHYAVMRSQQAVDVLADTASPQPPIHGVPSPSAMLLLTAPAFYVERWSTFVEGAVEAARRQLQMALVPAPNQLLELVVQVPRTPPIDEYFEEMADNFVRATAATVAQRVRGQRQHKPHRHHHHHHHDDAAEDAQTYVPLTRTILVDCANGAGALSMRKLGAALERRGKEAAARGMPLPLQLKFELINDNIEDESALNDHCGADFVQKTPSLLPIYATVAQLHRHSASPVPLGGSLPPKHLHGLAYSLDGDADRIVGLTTTRTGRLNEKHEEILSLRLLDGDRFTSLFATAILRDLKLAEENILANAAANGADAPLATGMPPLKIGAVQTAYANGAATAYLRTLPDVHVVCAQTGVKHVHAKAEEFDIGIYFESNGHGTVLVQPSALQALGLISCPSIKALAAMLSPCCGDAVANLLAAEYCLFVLGWWDDGAEVALPSPPQTQLANDETGSSGSRGSRPGSARPKTPDGLPHHPWTCIYEERPSVQRKVTVADVSRFACAPDDEGILVAPVGAQERIRAAVHIFAAKESGMHSTSVFRAFARPSGTEPIVRVYAEAPTAELADILASEIEKVVQSA